MERKSHACPDCREAPLGVSRREFLSVASAAAGAAAVTLSGAPLWAVAKDSAPSTSPPETLVKTLYDTLTDKQKKTVCFAWDHQDPKRGLLRTFVANNWQITEPSLITHKDPFYTDEQRDIVRKIFEGLIQPEWQTKIDKQLEDDAGGFGHEQSLAIFGKPGDGKFEFVMTGRHMTLRCDGNSSDHVAFGGPIFYGHAASDFNEDAAHTGNVFWPQAVAANKVYQMFDGKQQKQALIAKSPREQSSGFRSSGEFQGLPVADMSSDQKEHMQGVLKMLLEPYRTSDQNEAMAALKKHGGLDACNLAFYQDSDIGNDKVWDNWRLEGPTFVWYFRGKPHVHVWVNVADDPSVKLNA